MWEDEKGISYTVEQLRVTLFELGMRYPDVVIETAMPIVYRGYTFRKVG